jgi:hypothetical protein
MITVATLKNMSSAELGWLTTVILDTQGAEIRKFEASPSK